ncbi:MAG: hypothetical protein H6718_07405 [Polyangiaceae bacterium]|nr:hypothetical protein [Myxococcales bacterium]MCB9585207.1 hypothetical protein [Polyangiaceae bacterium]
MQALSQPTDHGAWRPLSIHPWLGQVDERIFVAAVPHIDTDAQLAAYLDVVQAFTEAQKSPYAWIAKLGPLLSTTATQRRLFAESEKRRAPYDAKLCAGVAVVTESPVARGLVTAVTWLSPPAYPKRIVSSFEEGVRFARLQLALPIDPADRS